MKTNLLLRLSVLPMALLLMSFIDPYTVKRVTDTQFKYEFYTTLKKVKPKANRQYYWFKGGAIHQSESGFTGEPLDDRFVKLYLSNQLAEQGRFDKGLKTGQWKTWHGNGTLQSVEHWSKGLRTGDYTTYDAAGAPLEKGHYQNGLKEGQWINFTTKDTVLYKKGAVFVKKPKPTKAEKAAAREQKKQARAQDAKNPEKGRFFSRLFTKKKPETLHKPTSGAPKKDNFLKRLFKKKKQPKPQDNG